MRTPGLVYAAMLTPAPNATQHIQARIASPSSTASSNITAVLDTPESEIEEARTLIASVLVQQGESNKQRIQNPIRNTNTFEGRIGKRDFDPLVPPNSTVAAAAKLLTQIELAQKYLNGTLHSDYTQSANTQGALRKRQSTSFWMEDIDHSYGSMPFNTNATNYKASISWQIQMKDPG
jgi:hypothetical protein